MNTNALSVLIPTLLFSILVMTILTACGTYEETLNDVPVLDANVDAGRDIFSANGCSGCHGADGGTMALGVSRIIAQIDTQRDIENALFALQSDASDRDARMKPYAQALSPQEIVDVAAFIATLKN